MLTALSFDSAVMTFGIWVENRLSERDPDGKPIWTLQQLLGTEADYETKGHNNEQNFMALQMLFGTSVQ